MRPASYDLSVNGIDSARVKVHRATEHLQALEEKVAAFSDHPHSFVTEEHNGEERLRFIEEPPAEIAILAGEIVYQLRSALDHLAFELVKSSPATSGRQQKRWERNCEFPLLSSVPTATGTPPVNKTLDEIYQQFKGSCLPGITRKSFEVVEKFQPYHGGDGPTQLGWIASLSNIDKHRHFHILCLQAYQSELVASPRINSQRLVRLLNGAKVEPYLHADEDRADAFLVKRRIADVSISFETLPAAVADIPLDDILDRCINIVDQRVIPAFEKMINKP
jgi:hypothetical protein